MEENLIATNFSLLFLSDFEENFMAAAPVASSSDGQKSHSKAKLYCMFLFFSNLSFPTSEISMESSVRVAVIGVPAV